MCLAEMCESACSGEKKTALQHEDHISWNIRNGSIGGSYQEAGYRRARDIVHLPCSAVTASFCVKPKVFVRYPSLIRELVG